MIFECHCQIYFDDYHIQGPTWPPMGKPQRQVLILQLTWKVTSRKALYHPPKLWDPLPPQLKHPDWCDLLPILIRYR